MSILTNLALVGIFLDPYLFFSDFEGVAIKILTQCHKEFLFVGRLPKQFNLYLDQMTESINRFFPFSNNISTSEINLRTTDKKISHCDMISDVQLILGSDFELQNCNHVLNFEANYHSRIVA